MTSRRPYWCPKTMKRRPCWCPKPILWELHSFLMQTLSFVPIYLHRCWPREWKHSICFRRMYHLILSIAVYPAHPLTRLGRLNWTYCFSKTKLRCQNLYFELDNKQDAMRKLFICSKLNKFAPFLCFLVVCGSSRRQGELMLEKGVKYKLKGVDQALIRQEAVIWDRAFIRSLMAFSLPKVSCNVNKA